MKHIFVTGGVVSGLGKGICAASLGRLLKQRGFRVKNQKFDPYFNVDPGTMSPFQHGEVFVTDDGAETDLDLGHYERFVDESLTGNASVSSGKVFWNVLNRERQGGYLGGTVQIIPHVTDEIKRRIYAMDDGETDIIITEAFTDADIVYPKSWAPFAAMEERTRLYAQGDKDGIDALEKKLLAQNAQHKDWACTEEMMKLTRDGKALYLHCLPADITGLSCAEGEVDNSVFDRYIVPLYKQASYKPYIIAAMIFLAQVKDPVRALMAMDEGKEQRKSF